MSDSPFSMFGESSKKRIPKKKEEEKLPPTPEPTGPITDDDVSKMIKRFNEMKDDLNSKMLDIYDKSGIPRERIEQFFSSKKGVPQAKLEEIENKMKNLENQVARVIRTGPSTTVKQVKEKKETEKRKKKFIGKRKKWLEM